MSRLLHTLEKIASLLTKYIGLIIICFSVLAFFWRDGFAWTTNYTSVFLGVAMFGMGLTIHMGDFKVVFTRPKEVILGFIAQYTLMPVIAWLLATAFHLPADLALGVILVGCCPGGTASNVITYIAGGDVALSVGMTIASTLAAPLMTPLLVYLLAGAWVEVSFFSMVISVVKVVLIPVLRVCGSRNCNASQSCRHGAWTWSFQTFSCGIYKSYCHCDRSRDAEQRSCDHTCHCQFCSQSICNAPGSNLQRMA